MYIYTCTYAQMCVYSKSSYDKVRNPLIQPLNQEFKERCQEQIKFQLECVAIIQQENMIEGILIKDHFFVEVYKGRNFNILQNGQIEKSFGHVVEEKDADVRGRL